MYLGYLVDGLHCLVVKNNILRLPLNFKQTSIYQHSSPIQRGTQEPLKNIEIYNHAFFLFYYTRSLEWIWMKSKIYEILWIDARLGLEILPGIGTLDPESTPLGSEVPQYNGMKTWRMLTYIKLIQEKFTKTFLHGFAFIFFPQLNNKKNNIPVW